MRKREYNFLSSGVLLFALNIFASALNYAYQIVIARELDVNSFGMINAIFSFVLIIGVPGTTMTMVASRYIASISSNNLAAWSFVKKMNKLVFVIGSCGFIIGVVLRSALKTILKIESDFIIYLTIIICVLSFFHPLYSGVFAGLKKFVIVGMYSLLIPVYKILGVLFAKHFFDNTNIKFLVCLWSIILGSILTAFLGFYGVKILIRGKNQSLLEDGNYDKLNWLTPLIINTCTMIYMNIDILAVRYLSSDISGIYSAVTLLGRIVYYGATSLGMILLPVAASSNRKESFRLLNKVILGVGGASIAGLLLIYVLRRQIVLILYGDSYILAIDYMGCVSIIAVALGIMTILINYLIGINRMAVARNSLLLTNCAIILAIIIQLPVKPLLYFIGMSGLICDFVIYISFLRERYDID